MKKYNYVYKITNLVNGKIYIGKHSTDDINDGYMGSGVLLHQAYKKYGLECFNKEVIDYYNNEAELNQGEIYWIARFNSTDPKIGYNLTYGGEGGCKTEQARQKMSEAKKGIIPWNKGVPASEEHRRKLSAARKGKPLSEECKQKVSAALTGRHLSEEHKQKIRLVWQKRKLEKLNQQINDQIIP